MMGIVIVIGEDFEFLLYGDVTEDGVLVIGGVLCF